MKQKTKSLPNTIYVSSKLHRNKIKEKSLEKQLRIDIARLGEMFEWKIIRNIHISTKN